MNSSRTYRRLFAALAMLHSMAFAALGQVDSSHAPATPSPFLYIGGFLSTGWTAEFADLGISGFALCDSVFQNGSGTAWGGGLLVELPTSWPFSLQFRPGVSWYSGELRERINAGSLRVSGDSTPVPVLVDQILGYERLDLSVTALAVMPMLRERLKFAAGLQLSHTLRSEQTRTQVVVAPDALLFSNLRREQVLLSGNLLSHSPVVVGLALAASYDFPIGHNGTLSPEISASYSLNSLVADGGWHSLGVRLGGVLRFGLARSLPPLPPPDTTPIAAVIPDLHPHVETHPPEVTVRIDEYDSTEVLPLLTQVFFAEDSSELRSVYGQLQASSIDTFSTSRLFGSALDVYYQLLNIIGLRMRELPEATLTINGYRNSRESDPALARRRAVVIRDYLANVWKISSSRLRVNSGKLPPSPSRENGQAGYEENARVELVASDPNITKPVVRRHIQRTATPPAITFLPTVDTIDHVYRWRLQVNVIQNDRDSEQSVWKRFDGIGTFPDSIVWDWRNDNGRYPELPMSLGYMFLATPGESNAWQSSDTHRIIVRYDSVQHRLEHRRSDTTIEIYSLLLFDYDSPKVSTSDRVLLGAIGARIGERAIVQVTGYTDSLGEESHNQQLANMRAEETAKILRGLVPASAAVLVIPKGGERERFPYDTPEGRAHCRTVVIEVRTPLSSDGS